MKNYLYAELSQACAMEGISLTQWAEQNHLNRGVPTTLKQGNRPTPETLKKMVYGWSIKERGLRILEAYLKDEIERVGVSLDNIQPVLKSASATPQIDADLEIIEAFIHKAPKLRDAIHLTAEVLKSSMAGETKPVRVKVDASKLQPMKFDGIEGDLINRIKGKSPKKSDKVKK